MNRFTWGPRFWFVVSAVDCNDSDAGAYPGAEETCDGVDNNCDWIVDEFLTSVFFADSDGDGYGGADSLYACSVPAGYVAGSGDCDDGRPEVYPGAPEICDTMDNDCNARVDEDLALQTLFLDADDDGFGKLVEF